MSFAIRMHAPRGTRTRIFHLLDGMLAHYTTRFTRIQAHNIRDMAYLVACQHSPVRHVKHRHSYNRVEKPFSESR